ncbi:hypothetical protein ELQ37_11710, partial [Pseudomonas aeruginosa]
FQPTYYPSLLLFFFFWLLFFVCVFVCFFFFFFFFSLCAPGLFCFCCWRLSGAGAPGAPRFEDQRAG